MSACMRRLLRHKQQSGSYLVRGAGSQDAFVITHLKFPWLIQPSILLVSVSLGERSSGEMRSSWSSIWKRPYVSNNASGVYQMPGLMERSAGCFVSLRKNVTDIHQV